MDKLPGGIVDAYRAGALSGHADRVEHVGRQVDGCPDARLVAGIEIHRPRNHHHLDRGKRAARLDHHDLTHLAHPASPCPAA
jgi:hypothetical protein